MGYKDMGENRTEWTEQTLSKRRGAEGGAGGLMGFQLVP